MSDNNNSNNNNNNNNDIPVLAAAGEDAYSMAITTGIRNDKLHYLHDLIVWHGSSLALVAAADGILRNEFNLPNPNQEFATWRALGARPYYWAIPQEGGTTMELASCLRCVLDGVWSSMEDEDDETSPAASLDYKTTSDHDNNKNYN